MKLHLKTELCCLLILAVWSTLPASAQQKFKYTTDVQKIDSNGFYSIDLRPDLTGKCQPGLADIRLVDERGKLVPYLPGSSLPVKAQASYLELPHLSVEGAQDSLVTYVAENRQGLSVDRLWIRLRNTAVNRTINVLGSDDLKHWFAIKEDITLQNRIADKTGAFEEPVFLPASTYRYFKIEVNDRKKAPINILQTGIYVSRTAKPEYVAVPHAGLSAEIRKDTSLFTVSFREPYRVDKLHLEISGARYYSRRMIVYRIEGNKKEWLKDVAITSADNNIYIPAKAGKLVLMILNEDNPPLVVKSVQVYQLKQSLVAYLGKQHTYRILFGNPHALPPRFDLQFFRDSIGTRLPTVSHSKIISVKNNTDQTRKPTGMPAWAMWGAGGLALLVLLMLTLRMTKEVGRNSVKEE